MIYLNLAELLHVAERNLGSPPLVRDAGLLASALALPQASAFGAYVYPDIHAKAAAVLHSIARSGSH